MSKEVRNLLVITTLAILAWTVVYVVYMIAAWIAWHIVLPIVLIGGAVYLGYTIKKALGY